VRESGGNGQRVGTYYTHRCGDPSLLISPVHGYLSLLVVQRRFLHRDARTKDGAIESLDEWGNAKQASLSRMSDCMFDFRLSNDAGPEASDTSLRHLPRRAGVSLVSLVSF